MKVTRSLALIISLGCALSIIPTSIFTMFSDHAMAETLSRGLNTTITPAQVRADRERIGEIYGQMQRGEPVEVRDQFDQNIVDEYQRRNAQGLGDQAAQQLPDNTDQQKENKQETKTSTTPFSLSSLWQSLTGFVYEHPVMTATIGLGAVAVGVALWWKWRQSSKKSALKNNNHNKSVSDYYDPLSQDVVFGGETIKGAECKLGDVRIIQLPVASQSGLSCGYHSLKNGILLAQRLIKGGNFDQLNSHDLSEKLFGHPAPKWYFFKAEGPWRAHVRKTFASKPNNHDYNINDISSAALESLIKFEQQNKVLLDNNMDIDIFAIDDIQLVGAPIDVELSASAHLAQGNFISPDIITPVVREHMNQARDSHSPYAAVFLLNTGREYMSDNGKIGGSQGNHWFTVVLWATGDKHTYIVTDSINGVRIPHGYADADPRLKRLINTIEEQPILP